MVVLKPASDKGFLAIRALVRFDSRMSHLVPMTVGVVRERLIAISAGVRSLARVRSHVQIEPSFKPERLRTVLALERKLVHVDDFVFLQRSLPLEGGSTGAANERFCGRMAEHVRFQVGRRGKALRADLTLEGTNVLVHALVGGQLRGTW